MDFDAADRRSVTERFAAIVSFRDSRLDRHPAAGAALAALLFGGALFRLCQGLFSTRSGRILEGLALAAVGTVLLIWSARRSADWRFWVAATSAASGFYYTWRAEGVAEGAQPAGTLVSGALSNRGAAGSTALILFIAAGVMLGVHLLGSWRDD